MKKCPYCGKEMELGYIQSRDGVYWCVKKRPVAAIPPILQEYIELATSGESFSGGAVEAYNCPDCKKIVVDYAEKE